MPFEFSSAQRICFGRGVLSKVPSLASGLGCSVLVVHGGDPSRAWSLIEDLRSEKLDVATYSVTGEPTTSMALEAAERAREFGADSVIGFGGGSVIDAAKAVAALLTNPGDLFDYLEVIGRGKRLAHPSAPCIAVPTTAGTGSEVTRNAVLGSPEHQVKVSLRSAGMLPRVAVVDPDLTLSVPPEVTASTGLDALTQLLEPFVSNAANPLTDGVCREGLARAARSLRRAVEQGDDIAAREDMALASLFGGLALANAKLGAVHGFAGPIGGRVPAPHGVVCARLLPHVMETNVRALRERDPASPVLGRFDEIARILTGRPDAKAPDAVAWIHSLCAALRVQPLAIYQFSNAMFEETVRKTRNASSMKGNPILLTEDELLGVLRAEAKESSP